MGLRIGCLIIFVWLAVMIIRSFCPSERAIKTESGIKYDPETNTFKMYTSEYFAKPVPPDKKSSEPSKASTADSEEKHTKIHEKVDHLNIALNKPVAEIFLDIKRIKGEDQKKYPHVLQFDSRRLKSHVQFYEWYSVNSGAYPSNLTDGNHGTMACPGDFAFDYVVDLKGIYTLSEIMLEWGTFGVSVGQNNYVTRWELYGQESFSAENYPSMEDWELIKKGGIPGQRITHVAEQYLKKPVRRLRIRASSEAKDNRQANWIGIHEIKAYGTPLNNN
ncbi:MAG: hypothetical protein ABIF87_10290 [Pseudomonadota bacterium]